MTIPPITPPLRLEDVEKTSSDVVRVGDELALGLVEEDEVDDEANNIGVYKAR